MQNHAKFVDVGWLFFHCHMGGGIRKNGDFVNPAFIEKALSEIDAVNDVYVYGLDVSERPAPGERDIVAAVVPADRRSFDNTPQDVHSARSNT